MWNVPSDVKKVPFASRLQWFEPPFGTSKKPAELQKWISSASSLKLTDDWAPQHADIFIENYLTMCDAYIRSMWRSLRTFERDREQALSARAEKIQKRKQVSTTATMGQCVTLTSLFLMLHQPMQLQLLSLNAAKPSVMRF